MVKYTRKGKITGDVAVMEVSQSSSLGVRTRAKTLALQRLHASQTLHQTLEPAASSSSYLELRSRRLEKPPPLADPKKRQQHPVKGADCRQSPNPSARSGSRLRPVNSGSGGSVSLKLPATAGRGFGECARVCGVEEGEGEEELGVEGSFGENNLEFDGGESSTRESTPCSLLRDPETIGTLGSTRRTCSTTMRTVQNSLQRNIPTTNEMEDFFACAEQQQERLFSEKYNFDVVNDLPLPGRYEWVSVSP